MDPEQRPPSSQEIAQAHVERHRQKVRERYRRGTAQRFARRAAVRQAQQTEDALALVRVLDAAGRAAVTEALRAREGARHDCAD